MANLVAQRLGETIKRPVIILKNYWNHLKVVETTGAPNSHLRRTTFVDGTVRNSGVSRCDRRVVAVDPSKMSRGTPPNETVPSTPGSHYGGPQSWSPGGGWVVVQRHAAGAMLRQVVSRALRGWRELGSL